MVSLNEAITAQDFIGWFKAWRDELNRDISGDVRRYIPKGLATPLGGSSAGSLLLSMFGRKNPKTGFPGLPMGPARLKRSHSFLAIPAPLIGIAVRELWRRVPPSAFLVLIPVLMMRWNVVIGGQEIAKTAKGLLSYHPPLFGREGLLAAARRLGDFGAPECGELCIDVGAGLKASAHREKEVRKLPKLAGEAVTKLTPNFH